MPPKIDCGLSDLEFLILCIEASGSNSWDLEKVAAIMGPPTTKSKVYFRLYRLRQRSRGIMEQLDAVPSKLKTEKKEGRSPATTPKKQRKGRPAANAQGLDPNGRDDSEMPETPETRRVRIKTEKIAEETEVKKEKGDMDLDDALFA